MKVPTDVSESFKKRNPHLYGLGLIRATESEQDYRKTLVCRPKGKIEKRSSPARFRVAIVVFRRTVLDRDNFIGGTKFLRDHIARFLGVDDAEKFITWEYTQHLTEMNQGTIIRIEEL